MGHLSKKKFSNKSEAFLLIFLGWLVYTISYLGKVNYSANITQIIDFYGVNKAQAGTVPTFFFFAYGIGQVVNGVLCKKYNIKWVIFISLVVSAVINLIVAVSSNFDIIKWLWLVNGFVLSILWPTLVRLLSAVLPQKVLGTSSVVMGTTVAIGTLIIYGLSSVFAAFNQFKLSFYTAGIAVIVVSFVWLLLYNKAVESAENEKNAEDIQTEEKNKTKEENKAKQTQAVQQQKGERKLLFTTIYVLCFCAVGVNLIKDGLTTWVPSILKDSFNMSDSISILLTLLLPVIAVFGNAFALKMHNKMPDYVNHCAAFFAVISVFICIIIGSLKMQSVASLLVCLIVAFFLISSLNSLITSIFPMFMRGKVNSGLFAGILNGFCYLGSTISSYGLGAIADNFGWSAVFVALLGFALLTIIVWVGYSFVKAFLKRNFD